jgi:hypothetical protein
MLLWNVLQSHQTRSYEQGVEVLDAILQDPEHADLAARYADVRKPTLVTA